MIHMITVYEVLADGLYVTTEFEGSLAECREFVAKWKNDYNCALVVVPTGRKMVMVEA